MEPSAENLDGWRATAEYEEFCLDELGDQEYADFSSWLQRSGLEESYEALCDWRGSHAYEQVKLRFLADNCRCDGLCSCIYDGEGLTQQLPGINCDDDETFVGPADLRDHAQLTLAWGGGQPPPC